jgi:hypothetical protein
MLKADGRRYERWMSVARDQLQNNAYEAAHRAEQGLTLEQAVEYALGSVD